jgi:hypothetical protein
VSIYNRFFNKIEIQNVTDLVKTSSSDSLLDEILYYRNIPSEYKKYFVNFKQGLIENNKEYKLILDYFVSSNLSQIFISNSKDISFWDYISDKLFNIINHFKEFSSEIDSFDLTKMYLDKMYDRFTSDYTLSASFNKFFNRTSDLTINSCLYPSIEKIEVLLNDFIINNCFTSCKESFIHGDLCFPNILINSYGELKLIDPRGRFGDDRGCFGDIRYDIAKIFHSLDGYDVILNNMYTLKYNSINNVEFNKTNDYIKDEIYNIFEKKIGSLYSRDIIKCIESTLFLSMLPLHKEDIKRQHALLVNGLILLKDIGVV